MTELLLKWRRMLGIGVVILGGIINANDFSGFIVSLFATVHSCAFANLEFMFPASVEVLGEWINKQVLSVNNRDTEFFANGKLLM